MRTFKINRNSWHYRLLSHYDDNIQWRLSRIDFCAYARAIFGVTVLTIALALIILVLGGCVLFWMYDTVRWIASVIYHLGSPTYVLTDGSTATWGIVGVIVTAFAFICSCRWLINRYVDWKYNHLDGKEPGFIVTAYKSVKDKFCMKVELE